MKKAIIFRNRCVFTIALPPQDRASLCSFILDKLPIVFNIGFMETLIFIASQCFVTLRKMKAYSYLVSFWQVIATRKVTDIMEATQAKRK